MVETETKHCFRIRGRKRYRDNGQSSDFEFIVFSCSDSISDIQDDLNESNFTTDYYIKTADYLGEGVDIVYR